MSGSGEISEPSTTDITEPETVATGVPAVITTMRRSIDQMGTTKTARTLLKVNQPKGFDCPGCAWPEPPPDDRKHAEFCENGAKAIAEEATAARADRSFFAEHRVSELRTKSDFWLGRAGRLTEPMVKPAGADHFEPIGWDRAFELVASELRGLANPDEAVFYTSGRASNEAAYVYQLFARAYGTNNLPDCSNMCHEPTSVALAESIGIGKGTVRLDDLYEADVIIVAGQNPGTNHPRMLNALELAKRNGAEIIAINPLPEAGLLRFKNPQTVRGIVGRGTEIADIHLPIQLGADQALFQLWNHWILGDHRGGRRVLDEDFVASHTSGFDELAAHLAAVDPDALVQATGLDIADLTAAYDMIVSADKVIVCWAMGITQHLNAVDTIREIVNFALLGGQIGKPGAGLCPVRGHSNVQGDRTMGVWEHADPGFIDRLDAEFGLRFPREDGFDTVETIGAFRDGRARVFVGLGGNFTRATPDTDVTEAAFADAALVMNIATKLNRTHLVTEGVSVILPCLGRTEIDRQDGADHFITVEDSMGLVHASTGVLDPPSDAARSEVAILTGLAHELFGPGHEIDWPSLGADYDAIRRHISNTIDGFEDFNQRVREPGGFELPNGPRDSRTFTTDDGSAHFASTAYIAPSLAVDELMLQTTRSHDQYNTTIYGHDDRYRGISGDRHVIMLNEADISRLGHRSGDRVDLVSTIGGVERRVSSFQIVAYPTPVGTAVAYYPETNNLIPLDHHEPTSHTPASKSVPIRIHPSS